MPKRTDINTNDLKAPPPLRGRLGGGACEERMHLHRAQELQTSAHARTLREQMTDAEKHLWKALRGKQLAESKFRRQFPIDCYIADFVCLEHRLVVELDGGQHASPESEIYDSKRTRYIESQGFRVMRFWNNEVLQNLEGVLTVIIGQLQSPPTLTLPRKGGGNNKNLSLARGKGFSETLNPESLNPETRIPNPEHA